MSPRFRELTADSAPLLEAAMGQDADRIALRFARGCRAFGAVVDGSIVSYGWLSTGPEWVGELSIEIVPAAGEGYVWNCFTLERHRRRGHYRSVLQGIVAVVAAEGLKRLWIGSVDVPAEKADADAGFVRVLRFGVTPRGDARVLTVTPVAGPDPRLADEARHRLGLAGWSHTGPSRARVH